MNRMGISRRTFLGSGLAFVFVNPVAAASPGTVTVYKSPT